MSVGFVVLGEIAGALGFSSFFIILGLIGVLLAKKSKWAWALYGLGICFQISAFRGGYLENGGMGTRDVIALCFCVSFAILYFVLIFKRRKNGKKSAFLNKK